MTSTDCNPRLYKIGRAWGDRNYDEKTGLIFFAHPPSVHMAGHTAHLLRESAYYAFGLLLSGREEEVARAARILELILTKQNPDPNSKFWACFTCEFEQDWDTWDMPDQNWAQFMGMIFGYILALDSGRKLLPADLAGRITESFRLTVRATLKRDVAASYTNISLLSAAVALAGAELLGEPGAEEFAHRKLSAVYERCQPSGTFDEYLSPTYYGTDLYALYCAGKFAKTPRVLEQISLLLDLAWADISRSYHPATWQLGGPHSRAYGDDMLHYAAGLKYYLHLADGGRYPLNDVETNHAHDCASLPIISTHPVALLPGLGEGAPQFRSTQVPASENEEALTLHQFRTDSLIFGSVSMQNEWEQRRNLLAYWATGSEPALGFCKGAALLGDACFKDAAFHAAHAGPAALVSVRFPSDGRDGKPARYRLTFNLPAAAQESIPGGGWRLSFPGVKVQVLPFLAEPGFNTVIPKLVTASNQTAIDWVFDSPPAAPALQRVAFAILFNALVVPGLSLAGASLECLGGSIVFAAKAGAETLSLRIPEG